MTSAVEMLESLIEGSRPNYSDFAVTHAGKPYHDALYSFCTGDDDLEIPELGINFSVLNARKHVTDNYEGKTYYDLSVSFKDNATGKLYSIVSEVYKGMDASYRNISVSEQVASKSAKSKKRKPKVPAIPADQAQALVDKLGTFFSAHGREVYVDSTLPEGDAFADAIRRRSLSVCGQGLRRGNHERVRRVVARRELARPAGDDAGRRGSRQYKFVPGPGYGNDRCDHLLPESHIPAGCRIGR
jgi:hypothetical protein